MAPAPDSCSERRRFFSEFKGSNQLLNRIHEAEIAALLADDLATFIGLQPQLKEGRKRRDEAADALLNHMREHGC